MATRGTPLHRFDLFSHIAGLDIAWAPVIAQGYHLPLNETGEAASVWPLGMSILMAGAFRLLGEAGLYLTGPVAALLAAPAIGWLALVMEHAAQPNGPASERTQGRFDWSGRRALAAGGLALFVWATSFEVIDRSLVPMADVAAALFTALGWVFLLKLQTIEFPAPTHPRLKKSPGRKQRGMKINFFRIDAPANAVLYALAAGLALGLAFDIRYTQLMLVAGVVVGVGGTAATGRQRAQLLAIAGAGALAAALPDILYRWRVFGSPLANPQERELIHFAWANVIPSAGRMGQQLLHGREFGLLVPFLAAGIIRQWRRDRRGFVTLTTGAGAVALLQLPYESIRLRDLLPLFPLLAAWTGLGMAWVWHRLVDARPPAESTAPRLVHTLVVGAIFGALLLSIGRVKPLVTRTRQPHRASFGYVSTGERTALAQLELLTPAPSAIGVHLNGGAIALHSQRWPFYPGGWTAPAFDSFLACMAADEVPVFLLDDGPSVRPVIDRLAAAGRLRSVARLDVPLPDEGGSGELYEVLRDESDTGFYCER